MSIASAPDCCCNRTEALARKASLPRPASATCYQHARASLKNVCQTSTHDLCNSSYTNRGRAHFELIPISVHARTSDLQWERVPSCTVEESLHPQCEKRAKLLTFRMPTRARIRKIEQSSHNVGTNLAPTVQSTTHSDNAEESLHRQCGKEPVSTMREK